jgi:hydrogenase nickel incorporation protein HypA/HybF
MGIAASVLEAVEREMQRYPGRRAAKVGLRIGELAGVDAESVRFCFDVIAKDAGCGRLELAIESAANDELDFAYLELEEVTEA